MTWSRALPAGTTLLLILLVGPAPLARASDAGPWRAPLGTDGVDVARGFDPPRTTYGAGHRGVDLRATPGVTVRAAGAGRVSYASVLAGRGVVVVVHGELRTTYEPVTTSVSVGSRVVAGDPLGTLDASHPGHPSCAPSACLHWGLRRGDTYLDPLRLLHRRPSVLLPLTPTDRSLLAAARRLDDRPAIPTTAVTAGAVANGVLHGPPAATRSGRPGPSATTDEQLPTSTHASAEASAGFALRGADLPLAAGALLALCCGLGLLVRRPATDPRPVPDPDDPPVAPALGLAVQHADHGAVAGSPGSTRPDNSTIGGEESAGGGGVPVDLAVERVRRRAA